MVFKEMTGSFTAYRATRKQSVDDSARRSSWS